MVCGAISEPLSLAAAASASLPDTRLRPILRLRRQSELAAHGRHPDPGSFPKQRERHRYWFL